MDLRVRLLAAVDDGISCRAAAARFGVAPSTANRWHAPRRDAGDFAAKPPGGDMHSRRVEDRALDILAVWEAQKDIKLVNLRLALAEMGLAVSVAGLHRFFVRRSMTRKKTEHAIEQDRPDVLRQRQRWFDCQLDLDLERLVFIDETWTANNMTRSHGRCARGERLRMGFLHGQRKWPQATPAMKDDITSSFGFPTAGRKKVAAAF
jgi:transposase